MNGVSRGRRAAPVVLSEQERLSLQSIVRNNRTPKGVARRCRGILLFADGLGSAAVAAELGVSDATVSVWRRNALEHGIMRRPGGPWTDRGHRLSAETTTEVAHWVKGIKGRRSIEVVLDDEERSILERNVQNPNASGTFAVRCKAILYCADGLSNREVGRELGLCNATVAAWRRRFLKDRIEGLSDKRKRRRECPPVNGRKVEEIARGEIDLGRRPPPLRLDEDERLSLEMLVRSRCGTGAISDRCRIILRCADGLTNKAIAAELDMTPSALGKWRKRFFKFGIEGLLGRPRMDLGDPVTGGKAAEVIDWSLNTKPAGAAHWTVHAMAEKTGLPKATIQRLWGALGVHPRPWKMLELSTSPLFVEKVRGIVGFYLSPPDRAMVLCVDNDKRVNAEGPREKDANGALALDPARPALPTVQGESRTRRSRVLGPNPLLLALDVVTGVDGESNHARDRAGNLHGFLQEIDSRAPHGKELHIIVNNDFIRTTEEIAPQLIKPPRWHVHVAPTRIAWAYQAEYWLGALTRRPFQSPGNASVRQLRSDIRVFLKSRFDGPKPFKWSTSSDDRLVAAERSSPRHERAHATNGRDNGLGERSGSSPIFVNGQYGNEIAVSGNCYGNTQQNEDTEEGSGDALESNARPLSKYDHGRLNRTSELFQLAAVSNLNTVFECNSYDVFDRAIQALLDARHVLIIGMDLDHACAIHMHQIAAKRFRNWHLVERTNPPSDQNLADLSPADVVVAIGTTPCCDFTLRVADYARSRCARVIGLTDWSDSSLVAHAHEVLFASVRCPGPFTSQVATMALVESLVGTVMARHEDQVVQRQSNT